MVFDLTLPDFPGKFLAFFDFQNKWLGFLAISFFCSLVFLLPLTQAPPEV
jgi:hypothetical protein